VRGLVLLGLVGCAHHVPVAEPACGFRATGASLEAPGSVGALSDRTIAHVRITGADPALRATLANVITTHAGDNLAHARIADDIRRLWAVGVLTDVEVSADGNDLIYAVTPQPLVDRVTITGDAHDAPELRRLRALEGVPYEATRIARMAASIEHAFAYDGYLDARVRVQRAAGQGIGVCVQAHRGPRVTIASLAFPGALEVDEPVLVAAMHGGGASGINRPGGIFDEELLGNDVVRLEAVYWDRGKADVSIGAVRQTRRGDRLAIEIPIKEGATYHYGALRTNVLGIDPAALGLWRGDEFKRTRVMAVQQRLQQRIPAEEISIDTQVDRSVHTIDLAFVITWRHLWSAFQLLPSR
jgi:outer membrane protein insertion porin family